MTPRHQTIRRIFAELPSTTGKSLDLWKSEILKNGPAKYRERVEWLKKTHSLKYQTACLIALQAGNEAVDYTDAAGLVNTMYAGPKAALRPLHERLIEIGTGLGPDVTQSACKTFISLKRKYVFLQVKPATSTCIHLGLALPTVRATARLIETGGLQRGDRITYRIPLSRVADIDTWVIDWVKKAYELTPAGN